ncbi:MAG: hypothetical protein Q4A42_05225 [Tissierellia bacterium]|nr:hypothetical protein [Tissierellia bacterium]
MIRKTIRILFSLAGIAIGYGVSYTLNYTKILELSSALTIASYSIIMVLFGLVFYVAAPKIFQQIEKFLEKIEGMLQNKSAADIIIGTIGLLLGLIISFFISLPISTIKLPAGLDFLQLILTIAIYFIFGTIGLRVALKNKDDITQYFSNKDVKKAEKVKKKDKIEKNMSPEMAYPKLLDTSVIIDGRIFPITQTGFVEGVYIIPNFVLQELQFIADSADEVKRERGRRGLDIVKELQNSNMIKVEIVDQEYDFTTEVDLKLLRLAKDMDACVVTNDYNLNKLAILQEIKVLNVNDLANAIKTIVIPGEEMLVSIIKEGREKKQGLAYLDDGTMIVVEEGKNLIGEQVHVVVTTVLQTAAGKMIFAKPKDLKEKE